MKLYYYKLAGSFCVRIIANELGLNLTYEAIESLQTKEKVTESGVNFIEISPKNQIPVLLLDDGRMLTECSAILIFLAELKGEKSLLQEEFNKYRVLEWLSFIGSEMHKNFTPIINPVMPGEAKEIFKKIFITKLRFVNKELEGKDYLVGGKFTVADAYMFTVLAWHFLIKVDLTEFENINRYFTNLRERPSIKLSLEQEGLK